MIGRAFEDISAVDLKALVEGGATERRDLEFKQALPNKSDDQVREFLADVSSLANTQGGDLLFGIQETAGIATDITPIASQDVDGDILRLDNLVRDGLEPRIAGVKTRWIELSPGAGVILMRIPASFATPHRIRFRNSGRFFARSSRGKYEMDTHELRAAFTSADQLPTRLRGFHAEAVPAAHGINFPFQMREEPRAILSVIPLNFFREARDLPINRENAVMPYRPPAGTSWMLMLEGMLLHAQPRSANQIACYALTHRTGRLDAGWVVGGVRDTGNGNRKLAFPKVLEAGLLDMASATAARLREFTIEGPWVIFVTVAGIKDYSMVIDAYDTSAPSWRDSAALPELIVEHINETSLSPLFRSFWRLFGAERPS